MVSRGTAFGGDESTMAAALWPAYSFEMANLRGEDNQQVTLLDLVRQGWIDDKSNGPAHFRWIKRVDEDGGTIEWA